MSVDVVMPQMGESLSEGTVSRWLKKAGDRIEKDEILFEITTDKVDTEVPAPVAGTLEKILVPEGETVTVGTAVATIAEVETPVEPKPTTEAPTTGGGHFQSAHEPITFARPARTPPAEKQSSPAAKTGNLSPAVVSLAAEHGVPISEILQIRGTGTGGRITQKDVQRYLSSPRFGQSEALPSGVTSFVEVDVNRVVRYLGKETSVLPFVAEATVKALKRFPRLNMGAKAVHLGIATPTDEGLTVPVIKNADEMNFAGLARAIGEQIERARRGKVSQEDLRGATFTVTDPDLYGGLTATPVLFQPQVATLGIGTVQKKPVVIDDGIAIRPILVLSLTFDAHAIDGVTAAQYLGEVRDALERFETVF